MRLAEKYNSARDANTTKILNYITELSHTVGVDVSTWDIDEVFGGENGLTYQPIEINKKFFEKTKASSAPVTNKMTEDQIKGVVALQETYVKKIRQQIAQEMTTQESNIRSYSTNIDQCARKIADLHQKYTGAKSELVQHVTKIVELGFFNFSESMASNENSSYRYVKFTTNLVILRYKRGDGVNYEVPFGNYKVVLFPENCVLKVYPNADNIWAPSGYFHPYISKDNLICWGPTSDTASKLLAAGDFTSVFKLLASLLTQYHTGTTPYCSIENFHDHGKTVNGTQPWRLLPQGQVQTPPEPTQNSVVVPAQDLGEVRGTYEDDDCNERYQACDCVVGDCGCEPCIVCDRYSCICEQEE